MTRFRWPSVARIKAKFGSKIATSRTVEAIVRKAGSRQFELTLLAAARSIAARGDHRMIMPTEQHESPGVTHVPPLRIGLFGNQANQSYINAKALRRLGHEVDLVVQPNVIDAYAMARPAWEDQAFEAADLNDIAGQTRDWTQPPFVRSIAYDFDLQGKYQGRLDAGKEVAVLCEKEFGKPIAPDIALLLAQYMGHWPYLCAMKDYDVVNLSMAAILLGAFCPRPYVVMPLGGDLYLTAFDETIFGLLFRAGFRGAAHTMMAETDYGAYLDRLESKAPRSFTPLIVDTEIYTAGTDDALRRDWQGQCGGERFILSVCRQSWEWKGSDKLIRAFAQFVRAEGAAWRLVLIGWGDDVQRSRDLIHELGIADRAIWLKPSSKALLRRRQRAADIIADQFVMEGYGSSVLESLAAAKPVLIRPIPAHSLHRFHGDPPPFVAATSVDEIRAALRAMTHDDHRAEIGRKSRVWVERWHGFTTRGQQFFELHALVAGRPAAESIEPVADVGSDDDAQHLLQVMQRMHGELREAIRSKWNRSLPFADQITDRWERARHLGFDNGASVYDSALVLGDVTVGAGTWIGPQCVLDGSGGLSIGSTCSISAGCQIYTHETVAWAVTGGKAAYKREATRIGNAVYVGPGTIVAAGSNIGDHSVIGALSFVNGEIPPYSFAVGTPARVIGRVTIRDDDSLEIDLHRSKSKADTR